MWQCWNSGGWNYSGFFSFYDLLFGTFHLPDTDPGELGISEPMPETLLGQLVEPYRRILAPPPPGSDA